MSDKVLPNHAEDTKILAFHLYSEDWRDFMRICRELKKFHSEILRDLVKEFIKNQTTRRSKSEHGENECADSLSIGL